MDMTDQTYQFSLVCDITGEPTDKTQEIVSPAIEPNPITDYEYVLFPKSETDLDEDYILLIRNYYGTN